MTVPITDVEIRPLRFTDRLPRMRAFLEGLGLRTRIESERGGWADLVAGAGMVALHDTATSATAGRPGETRLSFEAADLAALAERLDGAGLTDVAVWDEAYGRVLSVDVGGERIWVDERATDLYGYRSHDPEPGGSLAVTPVLVVPDEKPWRRFLDAVGGTAPDLVGYEPGAFDVRLEFRTTEPLDALGQRLGVSVEDGVLVLTDPDGCRVRITRITRITG